MINRIEFNQNHLVLLIAIQEEVMYKGTTCGRCMDNWSWMNAY